MSQDPNFTCRDNDLSIFYILMEFLRAIQCTCTTLIFWCLILFTDYKHRVVTKFIKEIYSLLSLFLHNYLDLSYLILWMIWENTTAYSRLLSSLIKIDLLSKSFRYILSIKLIDRMIDEDGNNKNFIHLYYLGERKTGNQFYILKRFSRCFMVVFQEYMKSLNLNKVSQISHHGIEK